MSLKGIVVSDFTIDNFASYLNNSQDCPLVKAEVSPFGQVFQVLMQKDLECWKKNNHFAVIWTRPESVIKSFQKILMHESFSVENIMLEVDEYAKAILDVCNRVKYVFLPSWVCPTYHRNFGLLDMKKNIGMTNVLMQINLRLSENFANVSNIHLLNTQKWIEKSKQTAFNPKLWYMGKIAFGNEVFSYAAKDLKAALRAVEGQSRKLIVLDLDDTLWGGVVGDLGWENITLGGHDPFGEAYLDFQKALKSLANRGILLAIVSKNNEEVALEAIKKHPEMVLGIDDFVAWKINWEDKAKNIAELVSDLGLGLQSVVFIDNSPFERARIKEELPEIFVPDWPQNAMLYKSSLLDLSCFDTTAITQEDLKRSKMYVTDEKRKSLKQEVGSLDEWLRKLNIIVKVEDLNETNLARTTQLFNKTNQVNLTTRRMSQEDLMAFARKDNCKLFVFRVFDKFGDYGLTGIVGIEAENNMGKVTDFVLSCRVMGRKVEEVMLYVIIQQAKSLGLEQVCAEYKPTAKNKPCLDFWKKSGFSYNEADFVFYWSTKKPYIPNDSIKIEENICYENYGHTAKGHK